VVRQVFPDARDIDKRRDPHGAELFAVTDSGVQKNLGGADRACREDDFLRGLQKQGGT